MIKRKYFKKLFIIYFSIMLVFGVILSAYYMIQTSQSLQQQQNYNNAIQADQIVEYIDQRLWSLNKYTDTLLQDKDFADYVVIDDDYYIYTQLFNKLRDDMAVFTDMGVRIGVTKLLDNFVITNQSTRDLSLFVEEMSFDDEMINQIEDFYYNKENNTEHLLMLDETTGQLHIINKKKARKTNYVLIIVSIDTTFLREKMTNNAFEFYVGDVEPEANDEWMSVRTSNVYSKLHYKVVHNKQSFSDNYKLFITGGLMVLLMLLIGYIIALILAKRIYKPIGKVVSSFGEAEDAVDEFAYIQSRAETIVEANQSLKLAINEQRIDLKTKFLRDVVYGLIDSEYAKIGMNAYELSWMEGRSEVAIIDMHEIDEFRSVYSSDARTKVRNILYTIIVNVLDMEEVDYELIELAQNSYALIIGHGEEAKVINQAESKNMGRPLVEKILQTVEANEEVGIRIALGEVVNSIEAISHSYDSAKAIFDFRQSYDQRALVTSDEMVDIDTKGLFYYTLEQERDLYNATVNGAAEKIEVICQKIIRNNFIERTLSSKEELNLMMSLATTYRRVEQKVDMDKVSDDGSEIKAGLGFMSDQDSGEALIHAIERQFKAVALKVKQKAASSDSEMSERMVNYIYKHFNEDISLEEVATSLNISAGYFCAVFKKHTGTNFKSYLNEYRVEKAKEIIKAEDAIKIKDLTLRVGYTNVNSFIRMFKKHEGISPGEYAKRNT